MRRIRIFLALMLTVALVMASVHGGVYAKRKSTNFVVTTQEELIELLNSKNKIRQITIKTKEEILFEIPAGSREKVKLIVEAPNATVTNLSDFKEIIIKEAEAFTELCGDGNKISIKDDIEFTVGEGAYIQQLEVRKKGAKIDIINYGIVNTVNISREADVNIFQECILGNINVKAKIKLDISSEQENGIYTNIFLDTNAKNTEIISGIPVEIKTKATTKINLLPGAEKARVTVMKNEKVSVINKTTDSVTVKSKAGEKTVDSGMQYEVKGKSASTSKISEENSTEQIQEKQEEQKDQYNWVKEPPQSDKKVGYADKKDDVISQESIGPSSGGQSSGGSSSGRQESGENSTGDNSGNGSAEPAAISYSLIITKDDGVESIKVIQDPKKELQPQNNGEYIVGGGVVTYYNVTVIIQLKSGFEVKSAIPIEDNYRLLKLTPIVDNTVECQFVLGGSNTLSIKTQMSDSGSSDSQEITYKLTTQKSEGISGIKIYYSQSANDEIKPETDGTYIIGKGKGLSETNKNIKITVVVSLEEGYEKPIVNLGNEAYVYETNTSQDFDISADTVMSVSCSRISIAKGTGNIIISGTEPDLIANGKFEISLGKEKIISGAVSGGGIYFDDEQLIDSTKATARTVKSIDMTGIKGLETWVSDGVMWFIPVILEAGGFDNVTEIIVPVGTKIPEDVLKNKKDEKIDIHTPTLTLGSEG